MVKRRGFYVEDNKVKHVDVEIEWNLGFTREAKIEYIKRVYAALSSKGFTNSLDVTSANKTYQGGYILSPIYLKINGRCVEDMYQEAAKKLDRVSLLLYASYLIGLAVGEKEKRLLLTHNVYIDVFGVPERAEYSQSKAYAVWRLLHNNGNLSFYNNAELFYKWYMENVGICRY